MWFLGTLNPDNDGAFSDHRELILKTAKALVEDTKVLVSGAAGSQEQLASAAQNAVSTICKLFYFFIFALLLSDFWVISVIIG